MLRGGSVKRGMRETLAALLGVTARTLRHWRSKPPGERGPGRPGPTPEERARARTLVDAAWRDQGKTSGRRTVRAALGEAVRPSLVRSELRALKLEARRKSRAEAEARRTSVHGSARDALWSLDATHLDRVDGTTIEALVLKDVASTRTIQLSVGGPATASRVLVLLERAEAERGTLPLVLATDNGSPFVAGAVRERLDARKVVLLRSVPHTPRHNPWVERGIGELKQEADLGRVRATDYESTVLDHAASLARARQTLDHHRLRASRGYRTAAAVDAALPPWYRAVRRDAFYEAACSAAARAVHGCETARARQIAQREAILATAARFGTVTRTRGGVPLPIVETETITGPLQPAWISRGE